MRSWTPDPAPEFVNTRTGEARDELVETAGMDGNRWAVARLIAASVEQAKAGRPAKNLGPGTEISKLSIVAAAEVVGGSFVAEPQCFYTEGGPRVKRNPRFRDSRVTVRS